MSSWFSGRDSKFWKSFQVELMLNVSSSVFTLRSTVHSVGIIQQVSRAYQDWAVHTILVQRICTIIEPAMNRQIFEMCPCVLAHQLY